MAECVSRSRSVENKTRTIIDVKDDEENNNNTNRRRYDIKKKKTMHTGKIEK